jgi:hypothetical protein
VDIYNYFSCTVIIKIKVTRVKILIFYVAFIFVCVLRNLLKFKEFTPVNSQIEVLFPPFNKCLTRALYEKKFILVNIVTLNSAPGGPEMCTHTFIEDDLRFMMLICGR